MIAIWVGVVRILGQFVERLGDMEQDYNSLATDTVPKYYALILSLENEVGQNERGWA